MNQKKIANISRSLASKLLLPVVAVALMFVSACNSKKETANAPNTHKQLRIGMSFQEMENPYFITMKEAVQQCADSIGAQLYITDARHDITKQVADVEDLIQKKIDILLLNPTDTVGIEAAVIAAKKAGIIVVAVDADAKGPKDCLVSSKNYDAGFEAGDYLAKSLKGTGKVAILDGIPTDGILARVKGFREAVAKYPGIQIVDVQNGKQERSTALSVTENMIQANPDLNGIFSVNDTGALGSLAAIQASGKNILLVSVDGFSEAVDNIKKGGPFIGTSAQFPRDQIRIALGIALAKYWGANIPDNIPVAIKLINKDNAEGFSW